MQDPDSAYSGAKKSRSGYPSAGVWWTYSGKVQEAGWLAGAELGMQKSKPEKETTLLKSSERDRIRFNIKETTLERIRKR